MPVTTFKNILERDAVKQKEAYQRLIRQKKARDEEELKLGVVMFPYRVLLGGHTYSKADLSRYLKRELGDDVVVFQHKQDNNPMHPLYEAHSDSDVGCSFSRKVLVHLWYYRKPNPDS